MLNELASVIRKALTINKFQQVSCLVKRLVWNFLEYE